MHLPVILQVHHLNDNLPSPQMAQQPLGKRTFSKTDEFLEKFQTAFDPPPTFSRYFFWGASLSSYDKRSGDRPVGL